MDLTILIIIFLLTGMHIYVSVWKGSKAPSYVTAAHIFHIGFSAIFLVGIFFETIQASAYSISYLVLALEVSELYFPFVFQLRRRFQFLFDFSFLTLCLVITVLIYKGIVVYTVAILMILHLIVDLLYIVKPISESNRVLSFFCSVACLYCVFQTYAIVSPNESLPGFVREMYFIAHSCVLFALSFVVDSNYATSSVVAPIITTSSKYDLKCPAIASPVKRQIYTTLQID